MNKLITVMGVPIHLGQRIKGVDLGPDAIRYAGLHQVIQELGYDVKDLGNISMPGDDAELTHTCLKLKHLTHIKEANTILSHCVSNVVHRDEFPLLLGGDHSMAIGTVAGLREKYARLGLIWFDAHGDLNTIDTSPSGNIHGMSLAVSLGYGHTDLIRIGGISPKVLPENTVIIGARDLDPGERALIKELGVHVFSMHDIDRLGIRLVVEKAIQVVSDKTDAVHVSFDLDCLDESVVKGVGTPVVGGLTYREGHLALRILADAKVVSSAEFVEVNPLLDDRNQTAKCAVGLIAALLGENYVDVHEERKFLEAPL